MAPYQYLPLNSNEIRLLTLSPGNTGRVTISIKTAEIGPDHDHNRKYEALSYTWGSQHDLVFVDVHPETQAFDNTVLEDAHPPKRLGRSPATRSSTRIAKVVSARSQRKKSKAPPPCTLAVTQNLAQALPYLQLKGMSRTLWVDAICINQQDLAERSQQVKLMADIYGQAEQVIAWLGPEAADSALAIKTLKHLGLQVEVDLMTGTVAPVPGADNVWADRMGKFPFDEPIWLALEVFFRRAWFERLWIWQEVHARPERTILMCGKDMLPFAAFRKAVYCLGRNGEKSQNFAENMDSAWKLCMQRDYALVPLLYSTNNCKCSDPRDRVYALLGMVDAAVEENFIDVDYTKNVHEVYQETVIENIKASGRLDLLRSCEFQGELADLPSWTPDWRRQRRSQEFSSYLASGLSRADADYDENRVLEVTGVMAACIESTHGDNNIFHREVTAQEAIFSIWHLIRDIFDDDSYQTVQSKLDAHVRTLCGNDFADRDLSPDSKIRPDVVDVKEALMMLDHSMSKLQPEDAENEQDAERVVTETSLSRSVELYLKTVINVCEGRCLVHTKDGHVGLAPGSAQPGDQVGVILGCHTPLVLRRLTDDEWAVIGECYIHGLMDGEALLGQLPDGFEFVRNSIPGAGQYGAYINRHIGVIQITDPRLGPLPPGWEIGTHEHGDYLSFFVNKELDIGCWDDPRLLPDALRERQIQLHAFKLV